MTLAYAAFGGLLLALSHPTVDSVQPYVGGLLSLPGVVLLMIAFDRARTARGAIVAGWLSGFVYFEITLHWLAYPMLVDPAQTLWALPFAVIGIPAVLSLFWSLAFVAARFINVRGLARAASFTLAICAAEWMRSELFGGFPWALLGYAWIDTPMRNLLPYLGIHGLSFLAFFIPAFTWVLSTNQRGMSFSMISRVTTAIAIPFILFIFSLVAGLDGLQSGSSLPQTTTSEKEKTLPPVSVLLVQPNIPQREKWDPEFRTRNLYRLITRSTSSPAGPAPDILIWPEAALPLNTPRTSPSWTDKLFTPFLKSIPLTSAFVFGAITTSSGGTNFNSLEVLSTDSSNLARYDKNHRVPFGEYTPMRWLLGGLGIDPLGNSEIARGAGSHKITIPGIPPFIAIICYEAIFSDEIRRASKESNWLLQITNDAWFGPSAGPRQHFVHARARAAELGLPLVRVANTGVTATIDKQGNVIKKIPLHVEAALRGDIYPQKSSSTLYAQFGNLMFWIFMLLACLWALIQRWHYRRSISPMHTISPAI